MEKYKRNSLEHGNGFFEFEKIKCYIYGLRGVELSRKNKQRYEKER